VSLGYQRAGF